MDVYNLLASISLDTTEYEAGLKKAERQGKIFSNDFAKKYTSAFEKGAKTLAKWAIAAGGAASAVAGVALKIGSSFESAMSETQAIFGIADKTSAAYQKLEATAREYGKTTQYSASESAAALKYMALAGWDVQQSTSALPGVLNLAAAASMDLAQASDMVTDYMSAFGIEADKSTYFADALAYAQNHANTTVDQLGQAFQNCAANMNASGQDFETTTALLEGMANQGTKGSLAGTQLAAMMRDLTAKMKSGSISIGNAKIAVQDANGNFRDMTDILKDVSTATDGMGDAQRATALSSVFTADSLKGVNLILNEGVDSIAQYEEELRKSKGTAEEAARINNDNFAGALKKLRSATEEVGIAFYEKFQKPLTAAIEKISDAMSNFDVDAFLQKVSGALEKLKEFAPVITTIIGGLTGLYGVMKAVNISKGIADVIAAISKAGGVIYALGGPIGIIITSIAAVTAGVATLYATNEDFRNAVQPFLDGVIQTVQNIWAQIQAFGEWVQPYIQAVIDFITTTVQNIIATVTPVMQSVGAAFSAAFQLIQTIWSGLEPLFSGIMGVVMTVVQTAAGIIGSAFQLAWTLVSSVWSVATSFFSTIFDTIAGIFSVIDDVLHGDFSDAWEAIKGVLSSWGEFFQGLIDDLTDIFSGIGQFFMDVGGDVVQGLKDGISAAWEGLKEFVKGLWDGLKGIFHISADDVTVEGGTVNGSHAGGLDYVPYNNYVANLHRGEMVLTAKEADSYRKGEKNSPAGGVTVIQNIYSQAKTAAELMREAQYEQRRALMMGAI